MSRQTLQADLTWIDGAFVADSTVTIGTDGRIESVGRAAGGSVRRL